MRTPLPRGAAGEITTFEVVVDGKTRHRAVARIRDKSGKRLDVSRTRDTKGAARTAVREAISKKLGEQPPPPETPSVPTVADLVAQFVEGLPGRTLAPKTQQDYRYAAPKIVADSIASVPASDVNVVKVKNFCRRMTEVHGTSAAKHTRAVLRHSLELAVDAEQIPFNPAALYRAEPSKVVTKRAVHEDSKRSVTTAEVATLLWRLYHDPEALPMTGSRKGPVTNGKDVADLCAFLFATGCRIGEALGLRVSDLDLEGSATADLSGTVGFIAGVGVVRHDRTKTASSRRAVPLPTRTVAMLNRRLRRLGSVEGSVPVFGSPQKPLCFRDPDNLNKTIRKLFDRYGVDWGGTHLGRRYRVTSLVEKGVPIHKVADIVGHSNVVTTMGYLGRRRSVDDEVRSLM